MKILVLISILLNTFSGIARSSCCNNMSVKDATEIQNQISSDCCHDEEAKANSIYELVDKSDDEHSKKNTHCNWDCCGIFTSPSAFSLPSPKKIEMLTFISPVVPESIGSTSEKKPPRLS